MFARKLFENDDWLLSISLLGRYKILLKSRNITRKTSKEEGLHFLRTLECMSDLGIPIEPNSEIFKEAAEEFCTSIFGNGDARWKAYFSIPPHESAAMYAEEFNKNE